MSTFFDEIQKNYENTQQRTQNALATGINMIARKGDMLNQAFNNAMNLVGQQANILSTANQVPLQLSGMFANMIDNQTARKMQQEQFDKSYNLDKGRLGIEQTESNIRTKVMQDEIKRQEDERNKALFAENMKYKVENDKALNLSKSKNLSNIVSFLRKKGTSEKDIQQIIASKVQVKGDY